MGSKDLKTPPVMTNELSYHEWKSEVELWSQITEVKKEKQGGALFFTLLGDARDTVRSKLKNEVIASADGLDAILNELDSLYLKDSTQRSFNAYEDFVNYRRKPGTSIEDFIVQFNIKYNKIKNYDMTLPEGVLAYNLLISANLSEDQHHLCRATAASLTYEDMKIAIEKVATSVTSSSSSSDRIQPLYNRTTNDEHYFVSQQQYEENYHGHDYDQPTSSHPQETLYASQNRPYHNKNIPNQRQSSTLNPLDEFGRPTTCGFCHSIYHWISDCPHAPRSEATNRGRQRGRGYFRGGRSRGRGGRRGQQL